MAFDMDCGLCDPSYYLDSRDESVEGTPTWLCGASVSVSAMIVIDLSRQCGSWDKKPLGCQGREEKILIQCGPTTFIMTPMVIAST